MIICDRGFNGGMFGCLEGGEEGDSKVAPNN